MHGAGLLGVAVFIGPTATPLDHPGFDALYKLAQEVGKAGLICA